MTASPSAPAAPGDRSRHRGLRVAVYVLVAAALLLALRQGLNLRRWVWDTTEPVRFKWDINNAFNWGQRANRVGYVRLYETLLTDEGVDGGFGLDYTPLRLLVVTTWVRWLEATYPGVERWQNSYAYTWPMLRVNLAAELAAAVAMFLLVRHWVHRRGEGGWLAALLWPSAAALLLWFNPAVLLNAHGWPQWDVWAVPFFLWALWAASTGRWVVAGLMIALGAMLKGQILLVAPVLLLWPLMQARFGAVGRALLGFGFGVAVVAAPWLIPSRSAMAVLAALLLVGGVLIDWLVRRRRWSRRTAIGLALAWVTLTIWLVALTRGGSFAWYHVGFAYPARHHRAMSIGPVSNLAAILQHRYQWRLDDLIDLGWLWGWQPTARGLLIALYAATLLLCGIAAARGDRLDSRRLLLATIGPWLLMFTLLPQMHERYLLWAAACSAAWVAVGVGPLLLHLAITAAAWIMTFHAMLNYDKGWAPRLWQFIHNTHPDMGWALIALAGTLLVMIWPRRRLRPCAA